MLTVDEDVDTFSRLAGEDSYDDEEFSTRASDAISQMLKEISSHHEKDDVSEIEEIIETNPTSCLPNHVLQLAKHRRWKSVLRLVETLLTHPDSVLSGLYRQALYHDDVQVEITCDSTEERQDICMLVFYKILSLQKLKRYGELREYLETFYSYTENMHYSFANLKISHWAPLSLKFYIYCLLYYSSDATPDRSKKAFQNTSNDDLCQQLFQLTDSLDLNDPFSSNSLKSFITRSRLLWIVCDFYIRQNEYRLALKYLDDALFAINNFYECHRQQIFERNSGHLLQEENHDNVKLQLLSLLASRIEAVSCQGRILAECGALDCFTVILKQTKDDYECMCYLFPAANYCQKDDENEKSSGDINVNHFVSHIMKRASYQLVYNNALLFFSRGAFHEAQEGFLQALKILVELHKNPLPDSWVNSCLWIDEKIAAQSNEPNFFLHHRLLSYESIPDLISSCCVNISLCELYSGRMRDAIQALESIIRKYPTLYMTECCIFNLCTLYELGYDPVNSEKKKTSLWTVAKKLRLDDLADRETFRLA